MRKYLVILVLLFSAPAYAKYTTLNNLLKYMESDSPVLSTYAIGYVIGLADQLSGEEQICIPVGTKALHVAQTIKKRLETVPTDMRYLSAGPLVLASLQDMYPCKDVKYQPRPEQGPTPRPEVDPKYPPFKSAKQLIL